MCENTKRQQRKQAHMKTLEPLTGADRDRAIAKITAIASYAIEWLRDCEESPAYIRSSYETIGHMVACLITQGISGQGTGTSETIEALGLCELPDLDVLKFRLRDYLKAIDELGGSQEVPLTLAL